MTRDSHDGHDPELQQLARRLGAAAADRLDVERTAQAVLDRLRAGEAPMRSSIQWLQPAWMRAAAVVVVMLGTGLLVYRLKAPAGTPNPGPDSAQQVTSELTGLTPGQLQDVMAALEEPVEAPTVHAGEAGVEDLSGPELQSLLKAMED